MSTRDGYYQDLLLANLLRIWVTLGFMAIFAIFLSGCSGNKAGTASSEVGAARDLLDRGDTSETRNRPPQGGCDEKSGSAPKWPSERLSEAIS